MAEAITINNHKPLFTEATTGEDSNKSLSPRNYSGKYNKHYYNYHVCTFQMSILVFSL